MPIQDDVPTPSLLVDVARLERNITSMAERAGAAGVVMRPHAKTHKTLEVAARQLAAGAAGLTVATLGEAETFADAGFLDLFIAYPFWPGTGKKQRLAALAERARLRVGIDSAEAAVALSEAVGTARLEVLVEVDCGHHRSGVMPEAAAEVALAAARKGLTVTGVFTFPGHGYEPGMAALAAKDESDALEHAASRLAAAGHEVAVRSGGSTPTALHSLQGVVNELRPGIYVFNDAVQVFLGTCSLEQVALSALCTVVSIPSDEQAVLDAGSKVLGADRPSSARGYGLLPELPGAELSSLYEHHAVVNLKGAHRQLHVGDVLRVVPNHVCSAVNLADELMVTAGDTVVGRWRVVARGKNN
ncbi:MAG TPA: alanine racemase [Acidimicrobiales bacterium]|nr:alanine racemase [Acidimicrobiales bacterium]